jgi:hypothetical protein
VLRTAAGEDDAHQCAARSRSRTHAASPDRS